MEKMLLCLFTKTHLVDKKIEMVKDKYELESDIFVFNLNDSEDDSIITFNIKKSSTYKEKLKNVINIHRKKETDTLYTINAMNELIKEENHGILDENYMLDWEKYSKSLLLNSKMNGLEIHPITLTKRI